MEMKVVCGGDPIEECTRRGPPLQRTQPELERTSERGGGDRRDGTLHLRGFTDDCLPKCLTA